MPIYADEVGVDELKQLMKYNRCAECGAFLTISLNHERHCDMLVCERFPEHEGIEREASRYEKEGLASLNIPKRREIMEQEHGKGITTALDKAKLPMSGALTQPQAEHILRLVYPGCPREEIIRCAILCRDFGLHPLMKEVYLIPFKDKATGKDTYAAVISITASRKMAADRKGAYSFLDGTPRAATPEEITKQFGKNSDEERGNLISICILKGEKGNEATGFGLWPKNKEPYGTDKGNTQRNMANIRSERPAYSRLPGAALPPVEVIDEAYAEVPDVGKVDTGTGEIVEGEYEEVTPPVAPEPQQHWCKEHDCAFEKKVRGTSIWYAHKLPNGGWCNEIKKKGGAAAPAPIAEAEEPTKPQRDPDTLKTINDLYRACNEDFKLQPAQVIAELGVGSQTDIAETPAECYRRIAAVR